MAEEENKEQESEESSAKRQASGEAEFNDALRAGKLEQASKLLDEYKNNNGENAFYYYRLACLNEKRGQIVKAYRTFKSLFYENPAFMMGRNDFTRVVQLYIKEPYEEIDKDIKKTQAEYYKELDKKRLALSLEHGDPSTIPESTPYEFWRNNEEYFDKTRKNLEQLIELEPDELDVLNCLLRIYLAKKDQEHIDWFKNQISDAAIHNKELIAKRSAAALAQASKHELNQDFSVAIEIINLGLETDCCNLQLLIFKTEVLQKMGCLKEALAIAFSILKLDQHNAQATRLRKALEAQIMEDNLSVGTELLQKAELEAPNSPAQISKVRSAYSLLLDVISYDEQNLYALAGIYRCNIRMGEPLKAQKVLERIKNIDPSFDPYSIFKNNSAEKEEGEACFVATRVFGKMHPNTVYLRGFRDNFLKNSFGGRVFIQLYRNVGPSMAKLPEGSPVLSLSRAFIERLVVFLKKFY